MRLFLISWCVLAGLASTAFGDSQKTKRAKRHVAKAEQAYKAGRYEEARAELATAYSIDPQPQLLFSLGEVNVKLGKCDAAITFLHKFLESNPADAQVSAANEQLAACNATAAGGAVDEEQIEIDDGKKKPDAAPVPSGPPPPAAIDNEAPPGIAFQPPTAQATAPSSVEEGPSERAWFLEPVGLSLCGGGVLAVVGSVVLYRMAAGKIDDALATPGYDDAVGLVDDAHTLRTVSIVTAVVGVGLLGGGGYYFYRQRNARETRVTATATAHGAAIGLTGRF